MHGHHIAASATIRGLHPFEDGQGKQLENKKDHYKIRDVMRPTTPPTTPLTPSLTPSPAPAPAPSPTILLGVFGRHIGLTDVDKTVPDVVSEIAVRVRQDKRLAILFAKSDDICNRFAAGLGIPKHLSSMSEEEKEQAIEDWKQNNGAIVTTSKFVDATDDRVSVGVCLGPWDLRDTRWISEGLLTIGQPRWLLKLCLTTKQTRSSLFKSPVADATDAASLPKPKFYPMDPSSRPQTSAAERSRRPAEHLQRGGQSSSWRDDAGRDETIGTDDPSHMPDMGAVSHPATERKIRELISSIPG
ncbi:hypothetical protein F4819DRAFT_489386 [Hypoxylon fuscum]|nr:hypothetical protein F4819DRAFT_489386 [Hypoxylon fuscum]